MTRLYTGWRQHWSCWTEVPLACLETIMKSSHWSDSRYVRIIRVEKTGTLFEYRLLWGLDYPDRMLRKYDEELNCTYDRTLISSSQGRRYRTTGYTPKKKKYRSEEFLSIWWRYIRGPERYEIPRWNRGKAVKKNCEYRLSKSVRQYEYSSCWEWGVRLSDRMLVDYTAHKEGWGVNK